MRCVDILCGEGQESGEGENSGVGPCPLKRCPAKIPSGNAVSGGGPRHDPRRLRGGRVGRKAECRCALRDGGRRRRRGAHVNWVGGLSRTEWLVTLWGLGLGLVRRIGYGFLHAGFLHAQCRDGANDFTVQGSGGAGCASTRSDTFLVTLERLWPCESHSSSLSSGPCSGQIRLFRR